MCVKHLFFQFCKILKFRFILMKHTKQNKIYRRIDGWQHFGNCVVNFLILCCASNVFSLHCFYIILLIHNIYISFIIYTLEKSSNCHRHGFVHKFTLLQLKHINTKHLSRVSWIIGKLNHNMTNKILIFFCLGLCRWNWAPLKIFVEKKQNKSLHLYFWKYYIQQSFTIQIFSSISPHLLALSSLFLSFYQFDKIVNEIEFHMFNLKFELFIFSLTSNNLTSHTHRIPPGKIE